MKKITYYVQRYRPQYEAISKEVSLLANHFSKREQDKSKREVKIYNLHLDGLFNFRFNSRISSHHFCFYPITFPLVRFVSQKSRINHIYTSLGDLPFLNIIGLKRTILTAAASCNFNKVRKRKNKLKKLRKIVVESERQKKQLLSLGIKEEKIKLIYPPVDMEVFNYRPAKGNFKILYASCPTRECDFQKRGIHLILDYAKRSGENIFIPWRGGAYKEIKRLINKNSVFANKINNLKITPKIIKNAKEMNQIYAQAHCTLIPYTQFDDFLKLIPNSALESLAAGKPLLVSTKTELAEIVEKEKCGVVFEPNVEELTRAVGELRKNYLAYQINCRRTAEKYFSQEKYLREYQKVYEEIYPGIMESYKEEIKS